MKSQVLWACVCGAVALAAALPPPLPVAPAASPALLAAAAAPEAPSSPSEAAGSGVPDASAAASEARAKRSHGLLGLVANKVTGKIGSLSAASSGVHDHEIEYPPVTSFGHKSFDLWGFKKALFSTLLQAVKAIKGGLIALKGQLIKAKGHILTTKGALFKAKGEALTDFGRHIATKALLPAAPPTAPSAHGHIELAGPAYLPPHVYYGPPPSAPAVHYGVPYHHHYHHGRSSSGSAAAKGSATARGSSTTGGEIKLPDGVHAGLLILKPLSGGAPAALLGQASAPVPAAAPAPAHASPSSTHVSIQRSLDFDTPPDFGAYFHGF